jgi:hypothetical protein
VAATPPTDNESRRAMMQELAVGAARRRMAAQLGSARGRPPVRKLPQTRPKISMAAAMGAAQ